MTTEETTTPVKKPAAKKAAAKKTAQKQAVAQKAPVKRKRRASKSNLSEINAQIKALQAKADAIKNKELASVIAEIKSKIDEYGITGKQLGFGDSTPSKRGRKPGTKATSAKPKKTPVVAYQKGDDTWSGGRGRKPAWVQEIISKGGSIEKYRVK